MCRQVAVKSCGSKKGMCQRNSHLKIVDQRATLNAEKMKISVYASEKCECNKKSVQGRQFVGWATGRGAVMINFTLNASA